MKTVLIIFTWIAIMFITGCKDDNCYDAQLEMNHPGICTQDCPQVCGCDGQTYCNECIANSRGIRVDHSGPCD